MSEQKKIPEPFGYFKAEPFGWTDCAETDDCAIPLYDIESIKSISKQRDELLAALKKMNRAYVLLMENCRDRIIMLGGDCDPVDVMERNDPNLRESSAAIVAVKGGAA